MSQQPPEAFLARIQPAAIAVTAIGVLANRAALRISNALFNGPEDFARHSKMTGANHAVLFREGVTDFARSHSTLGLMAENRERESEWTKYFFDGHRLFVHRRSRTRLPANARYQGLEDNFDFDDTRWMTGKDEISNFPPLPQIPSPDKADPTCRNQQPGGIDDTRAGSQP